MKSPPVPMQPLQLLPHAVTTIAPSAPRNGFDTAGFVLLGASLLAFAIGSVVAIGGRS